MKGIQCVAQETLSPSPVSVQMLLHPYGGVAVVVITHMPTRQRNFFTVAELHTPNLTGAPMRVMRVRVPGRRVRCATPLRSPTGEEVYVLVQCEEKPQGSREWVPRTYLYKRVVEADSQEETDSSVEAPQPSERMSIVYQRLPRAMETGPFPWSAMTGLNAQQFGGEGKPVQHIAAASCSPGESTTLHLLTMEGMQVNWNRSVSVEAFSQFPITKVVPLPGLSDQFLCVAHNSLVEVSLSKCKPTEETVGPVKFAINSSNEVLTRAWRCAPEVSLTSAALKDHLVCCGTSTGSVLFWDLRDPTLATCYSNGNSVSPVTGVYTPDVGTVAACSLDGSLWCWCTADTSVSSSTGSEAPFVMKDLCENTGEGWIDMAGSGNLFAVIGEYGTLRVFLRV